MFNKYSELISKAQEKDKEIKKKYEKKRDELNIEFITETDKESKFTEEKLIKDYSPIKYYNRLTIIVNKFTKLSSEMEKEIKENKTVLDTELTKLIEDNPDTEMYKIIYSSETSVKCFCRVWFTLVPIEKWGCKKGDPVRIEWVRVDLPYLENKIEYVSNTTVRTGPGLDGLLIPEIDNQNKVKNYPNFYHFSKFIGDNTQTIRNWEEWVKNNRPC